MVTLSLDICTHIHTTTILPPKTQAIVTRDMNEDLVVTLESALTRTAALMEAASQTCRESPEVKRALVRRKGLAAAAGASCPAESDEMPAEFMECLTKSIAGDLAKKESEANKSMRMLEQVGDRARNYTCADPKMETSNTSLKETVWVDPIGGKSYNSEVGVGWRDGGGGASQHK